MIGDIDAGIDVEKVGRIMLAAPLSQALNLRLVRIEPGKATLEAPWRDDLVGDPAKGGLAGGVVTMLIDHACATTLSSIKRGGAPTLDLRIDTLRQPKPRASVFCEAECYRLVGPVAFVRATAWDDDPADPVASALAAFTVPEPKG